MFARLLGASTSLIRIVFLAGPIQNDVTLEQLAWIE